MTISVTSRKLAFFVVAALAILAAYLLGSIRPSTATAAEVAPRADTAAASTPGITVVGSGKVAGTPDTLTLTLSVTTSAPKIDDALASANRAAVAVQDALAGRGVDKKDMQTSGLSIQQDYTSKGQPSGYRVYENLTVTMRDLAKAGATMTAAVDAGGNAVRVDGLSLSLENTSALVAGARTGAIDDARQKATQYAQAAGRTLGPVVSITETVTPPNPSYLDARTTLAFQASAVPIQAGSQDVTVQVSVVYAFA
jgi:uncharacterized protein